MKSWLVRQPLFENFYFILSHSCGLGNNSTAIRTNIKVLLILFTASVVMRNLLYLCKGMIRKTTVYVTWARTCHRRSKNISCFLRAYARSLPQCLWVTQDFQVLELRTLLVRMFVFIIFSDFWQSFSSLVDVVPANSNSLP